MGSLHGLLQLLFHALLVAQHLLAAIGQIVERLLHAALLVLRNLVARGLQLARRFLGSALHFFRSQFALQPLLGLVHGTQCAFHAALQLALLRTALLAAGAGLAALALLPALS